MRNIYSIGAGFLPTSFNNAQESATEEVPADALDLVLESVEIVEEPESTNDLDADTIDEIASDAILYFYDGIKADSLINNLYKNNITDDRGLDEEVYLICSEVLLDQENAPRDEAKTALVAELTDMFIGTNEITEEDVEIDLEIVDDTKLFKSQRGHKSE